MGEVLGGGEGGAGAASAELEAGSVAETLRDLLGLEGGLERLETLRAFHLEAAERIEGGPYMTAPTFRASAVLEAQDRRSWSATAAELIGRRRLELELLLDARPVTATACEGCGGQTRTVGGRLGALDLLSCGHWVPAAVVLGGEVVPVLELEGRAAELEEGRR